jgi:transcriptional regulator with XRE-family HTH domain
MARTKFSELRRQVEARSGASERLAAKRAETLEEIRLYELRHRQAVSQVELAGRLLVTQGAISKLEHAEDVRISTLRVYLDALGARLEIVAVFDDEGRRVPIHLGQASAAHETEAGPASRLPGSILFERPFDREGSRKMVKGNSGRVTGSRAASAAGKTLANPKATPAEKSAAASPLAQVAPADQTRPRSASAAGKTLANPRATKVEKSAAASALSQTPSKKSSKKS